MNDILYGVAGDAGPRDLNEAEVANRRGIIRALDRVRSLPQDAMNRYNAIVSSKEDVKKPAPDEVSASPVPDEESS